MNTLVEDLRAGMKWNGKVIISVDHKEDSGVVIIWLQGEESARAFTRGTQMLVENVLELKG